MPVGTEFHGDECIHKKMLLTFFEKNKKQAFTFLLKEIVLGDLTLGDLPKVNSPLNKYNVELWGGYDE